MAKRTTSRPAARTTTTSAEVSYDAIPDIALTLKSAIESKSRPELQNLLGSAAVWLNNKPGSIDRLVDSIDKLTANATDLNLSIVRLLHTDISGNEAHVALECQLVWSNTDTWEEHEVQFELYLGLAWSGNGWDFTSVAILPARPAAAQPGHTDVPAIGVPYFESAHPFGRNPMEAAGPYFSQYEAIQGYFSDFASGIRSPYFSHAPSFAQHPMGTPQAPAPSASHSDMPGYVAVYMPVLVPLSLLNQLRG